MRKLSFLLYLGIFLILSTNVISSAEAEGETGTLIVTYKTDNKGERLNRIRFWLKSEGGLRQSLYPKEKAFVDDLEEPSRMIVIEDIPTGHYTLQFLVPNTDHYFQKVPAREVIITNGDVVKIDQQIKPMGINRGDVLKTIKPQRFSRKTGNSYYPIEIAKEELQKVTTTPKDLRRTGRKADRPEKVSNKEINDAKGFGKLILSYDLKTNTQHDGKVKFRLINSDGRTTVHPEKGKDIKVPLKSGKMVMVQLVPEGDYSIEFFVEGTETESLLTIKDISINANKTKSIHESLLLTPEHATKTTENERVKESLNIDKLKLLVTANIPTAIFKLENVEKNLSWEGKGRSYTFEGLPPGKYLLSFDNSDPLFVPPEPLTFELSEDQDTIVETFFQIMEKHTAENEKVKESLNIDKLKLFVTANIPNAIFKLESLEKNLSWEGNGKTHTFEGLLPGKYLLSFDNSDPLFVPPEPLTFELSEDQDTKVETFFQTMEKLTTENEKVKESLYHDNLKLFVTANIPTAIFRLEKVEESLTWEGDGRLHTFEGLSPGKYLLSFDSSDPLFVPPEPLTVELSEDQDTKVETVFQTLGKLKILSNISEAEAEIIDIDNWEILTNIAITNGVGTAYLPEGEYRIVFKSSDPIGKTAHPVEVKIDSLQTKEVNAYFPGGRGSMGVSERR